MSYTERDPYGMYRYTTGGNRGGKTDGSEYPAR